MIDQKVADLAKGLFSDYYRHAEGIAPPAVERREFGFGNWEKKIAYRHLAFRSDAELRRRLVEDAPPFASYSSAEYERPAARPMEAKGWLGSELLFDLDATDLNLPCQQKHGKSWVCDACMGGIKGQTVRLIEDFLVPDFGFSEKEISINFSGNRGYHVHVSNRDVLGLDSRQRRDITEYIAGMNISAEAFFTSETRGVTTAAGERNRTFHNGPRPSDPGWRGKLAKSMITALNSGEDALAGLGIERTLARRLSKKRADLILGISIGNWEPQTLKIPKAKELWANVIKRMSISQGDSIDKNVTNDTHHLLRIPNTIHGDTGLAGRRIGSVAELGRFDPMSDAIAFRGGKLSIKVAKSPKLAMGGEEFGPYENQTVELPIYAAVYLLLKRAALLA